MAIVTLPNGRVLVNGGRNKRTPKGRDGLTRRQRELVYLVLLEGLTHQRAEGRLGAGKKTAAQALRLFVEVEV